MVLGAELWSSSFPLFELELSLRLLKLVLVHHCGVDSHTASHLHHLGLSLLLKDGHVLLGTVKTGFVLGLGSGSKGTFIGSWGHWLLHCRVFLVGAEHWLGVAC